MKPPMALYHSYTDEHLVTLLKNSDDDAFTEIYSRYWLVLLDAAYKRLKNREQSEDILQEVFVRLWVRRQDQEIEKLAAYLHTAVRYNVLSYVARHRMVLGFFEPFEAILLETDTPDSQLLAKELLELVYAYAETLSERKKQIFLLRVKDKLSTKEIAAELGISQKSVQNQLGTALQGLQTKLSSIMLIVIATRL
jgi:RNA polymerase sigma factor (sigma-70 family)